MDSALDDGRAKLLQYTLAGLEAGIYGGLAMLGWFFLVSFLRRESLWRVPDLLGSTFYRDVAFDGRSAMVTISGIALHLLTSGVLGVAFGLLVREMRSYFRVALLGLLLGIGWYYLSYAVVWKRINPLIPLYSSSQSMLMAHFVFGAVLGRYPNCLRALRHNWQRAEVDEEIAAHDEDLEI